MLSAGLKRSLSPHPNTLAICAGGRGADASDRSREALSGPARTNMNVNPEQHLQERRQVDLRIVEVSGERIVLLRAQIVVLLLSVHVVPARPGRRTN